MTPYPVGRIVGAFGIQGEVKVEPLTDYLERMHKGTRLRLQGEWVTVTGFRIHKNRPLLKLSGIDTPEAAQALQWEILESTSSKKPELEEGEFLTGDLIGLEVRTDSGRVLGPVTDVLAMPAHDVLQVGQLLIPVVQEFVREIDVDQGFILVHLIPGMLDDES